MTIKFLDQDPIVVSRRKLVQGLAAGSIVAVAGCARNQAIGRDQLLLVSEGQIAQMAASSWTQIKRQTKISQDRTLNRRLNTVGNKIVQTAGLQRQPWEFTVFDDDQANAFVLPGGKVGFYKGIFKRMKNDDHLATVMGHEVGHVTAKHAAERYSQQVAAGVVTTAAAVALEAGDVRGGAQIAGILGLGVQFGILLPYSRRHELEADRLGVNYMHRAGYDARQAIPFWDNMSAQRTGSPPPEFMSTHPSDATRKAAIRQELQRLGLA
ncbi:MAG: peptidase M48 [Parvibaculum sp.]|jgi:predicted Zn-dependent protease|nr:peptidase M48 [Parvibaculum sp.]|tara:strand:- start:139 stop:939 length:801 start_codon:yes stop_codon:yes gene_type:complete